MLTIEFHGWGAPTHSEAARGGATSSALNNTAAAQTSGTGWVSMAVIASKDGTRPYQKYLNAGTLSTWSSSLATSGTYFTAVSKLRQFQNIHLIDLQSPNPPPTTGNMARPTVATRVDIPNAACISDAPFPWPLAATVQNKFVKVIEFDPQGSARVISSKYLDAIPQYIEIGLQPSHGTFVAGPPGSQTTGQLSAIQIDGMSGATRVYRP